MTEFTATGFEKFEKDLERLHQALAEAQQYIPRFVGQKLDQALMILQGQAAIYPAEPPNSGYVRTGTLGRRWTTAQRYLGASAGGWIQGTVGNNTVYGPFVQDADQQAAYHQGRWKTIQDIAREQEPRMQQFLADAAEESVEELRRKAGL